MTGFSHVRNIHHVCFTHDIPKFKSELTQHFRSALFTGWHPRQDDCCCGREGSSPHECRDSMIRFMGSVACFPLMLVTFQVQDYCPRSMHLPFQFNIWSSSFHTPALRKRSVFKSVQWQTRIHLLFSNGQFYSNPSFSDRLGAILLKQTALGKVANQQLGPPLCCHGSLRLGSLHTCSVGLHNHHTRNRRRCRPTDSICRLL